MKRENLTMFDLEAAFKALDEIEMPVAEKGIRANKVNLQETFKVTGASKTDLLLEDYYDISDTEDLEQAKADREAEVAKAKLARIEKIVDLAAESEEDLLPSYVGKVIIQCPQCMTLFYKEEADIVKSETDEETVNVAEVCQHCGNESGYTLIGKVEGVKEEELVPEESVEEVPADEENLDLEPVEEVEEVSEESEEDLDLSPVEDSEESEEEKEEEVVEESLQLNEEVEDETDDESNKSLKIVGFVDCSGSHTEDSRDKQIQILNKAGATEIYYFSDHVYDNYTDARKEPQTIYYDIKNFVDNNPNIKAIVTTDSDIEYAKYTGGDTIKNHNRIEIIRLDLLPEDLTEAVDKYKDAFEKAIKDKAEKEGKVFIDVTKDLEEISKQSTWAGRKTLDQIFKAVGGKDYCILKTDGYHCFYLAVEESKMNAFKAEKEKHYTSAMGDGKLHNVNEELTEARTND